MIDDKAIIFELPNDQGFVVYTSEFYREKFGLYRILTESDDSALKKLIFTDEATLNKLLITAEIEALKIRLKELEYKQS